MFASGMDAARESGGGEARMVLMRFTWPHGGRSVFLTGSFDRWTRLVPMLPMEGYPTIFQAICSVTPGFHQYKFFVDGEWRHDDHQPHSPSEYGIVNTGLFTGEASYNPVSGPEMPLVGMEMDNENFRRVVQISDGMVSDVMPRVSEADLQVSRHRVSLFLSTHTAYELLPKSGKVVALDVYLPVKQAFHVLHEQWSDKVLFRVFNMGCILLPFRESVPKGTEPKKSPRDRDVEFFILKVGLRWEIFIRDPVEIPENIKLLVCNSSELSCFQGISTAPLWDFNQGQFVGMLSALDFILILRELGNHGSNLTEEELDTHTISAWKEGKAYLNRQIDGQGRPLARRLIHAGPYDNLKEIALRILQHEVATIPIIHSPSEDGSFPQLLHLASLCGILKCICRYFRHCSATLPILEMPICSIPVGTWVPKIGESGRRPLAMLRLSASLSSALNLLIQAHVSCIPVVDDNDSLLDIYCRSDITALAKDRIYTHININEMTIHQALQLGQDAFSSYELRSQRCQMCLRSDTLHKVMERLANPGVRRLIIVEAGSKRVEGIITLSDIFKFLLG